MQEEVTHAVCTLSMRHRLNPRRATLLLRLHALRHQLHLALLVGRVIIRVVPNRHLKATTNLNRPAPSTRRKASTRHAVIRVTDLIRRNGVTSVVENDIDLAVGLVAKIEGEHVGSIARRLVEGGGAVGEELREDLFALAGLRDSKFLEWDWEEKRGEAYTSGNSWPLHSKLNEP